ncbi:MAG: class I SAM-dependent methyltransferase [Bacteroidales bacterium]|nr:class I SAM-dependent methyltransferase [Bacteroidales bacterium]
MKDYGNDKKSAVKAKYDAQKIAFGPIMFQAARAMRNLGILNMLHEERKNGLTINQVAKKCNLPRYGTKVLLEAAISLEMVYVRNNKFFLTKTGWFILNDPLTIVNIDFVHDVNYKGFFHLQECITNGKPEGLKEFGTWSTVYEALSELPPDVQKSWFNFDHYYSDNAFPELLDIIFTSKPKKILDVGGNTGKFSILCAKNYPEVNMTILDLPGQLKKAEMNISEEGLKGRIDLIPINLLDHSLPYPTGYDAVWMSQFLDCFPPIDIIKLLEKAKKALNPGGSIYILETYWDKQKYEASTYSLHATSLYFTCIANGTSQMYHSEDMYQMIEEASLKVDREWNDIGVSHTLIKCS